MDDQSRKKGPRLNRRQLVSLGAAVGLSGGLVGGSPARASGETKPSPRAEIARLEDVEVGAEIAFDYPDEASPAVLLRMKGSVEGGEGPDQSLVAYSVLCTHKGCHVSWNADQQILICPCHWSSFDPAKRGRMIIGQASQGLPRITLQVESGMIYATGVEGLIFGRQTNIL